MATLSPVPILTLPETPKPPTIFKAPEVDEVEFVLERIETAPTKDEVPWTDIPEPILATPDILKPVPPTMSPLTPNPPVIDNAPEVDEVEFTLERIDTAPTRVDEPWTDMPEAAEITLATLNPVPIFTLPETPSPPITCNAPEVDDVEFVFDKIERVDRKIATPVTPNPPTISKLFARLLLPPNV